MVETPPAHERLGQLLLVLPWTWFLWRGVHPWTEPIAITLPVLIGVAILVVALVAAYFRSLVWLLIIPSLAAFFVVSVILPGRAIQHDAPTRSIRLASVNLAQQWFSSNDVGFLVFDQEPDLFLATEVSPAVDDELRSRYDNAITDLVDAAPDPAPAGGAVDQSASYRSNDLPSIGLYSNADIELLDDPLADVVEGGLPGFRVRVPAPDGTNYIVYALHIPRPGRGGGIYEVTPPLQLEIIDALVTAIDSETEPVIIIGDLNIVDRSTAFRKLSDGFVDAMRVGRHAGPTRQRDLNHTLLRLRIDHVLVDESLCVNGTRAPTVMFTDHTPIQADIGPCP